MDSGKARALVLIHQKTQQRYPLQGDFVIGRSNGHLVFDHDPKLSGKHCLIRADEAGFAIYDLKSRTGILINGAPLPSGKGCRLKAGAQFTVGDQCFAVDHDRRLHPRRKFKPLYASLAGALILLTGLAWAFQFNPRSPNVDAEMHEAMQRYQALGEAVRRREIDEQQSLVFIRQDLIPRFVSVRARSHADRQRRLAETFVGQLTAMGNFIETKQPKYSQEISAYNRQMESLSAEFRRPASQ